MPDERPPTSPEGRRAAVEKMKPAPITDRFNSRDEHLWSELLHQEQRYRELLGYPPVVHDPGKYLGTNVADFLQHLNTLSLYAGHPPPWIAHELRVATPQEMAQYTPEWLAKAKAQMPILRKLQLLDAGEDVAPLTAEERNLISPADPRRNLELLRALIQASGNPEPAKMYEELKDGFAKLPTSVLEDSIITHPKGANIIPPTDPTWSRALTPAEARYRRHNPPKLNVVNQLLTGVHTPGPEWDYTSSDEKIEQIGTGLSMGAPSEPSPHLAHGLEYIPGTPEYYERETDTGMLRFDRDWAYTPNTPEWQQHRDDISQAVNNLIARKEDTPWDLNKLEDEWRTVRRARLSQEAHRRQYPDEEQAEEQDSGTE